MPELPEVATIVRGLQQKLIGCTIESVQIQNSFVIKDDATVFQRQLERSTIQSVLRHGKAIFLAFESKKYLQIHLGMTGQLLFLPKNEPCDSYTRVVFQLKNASYDLRYRDIRQFGRMKIVWEPRAENWGPDAWESSKDVLFSALRNKKGMVKHTLLNQNVVAGLGNIYVDESLHTSRIHPKKRLESLKDSKLGELCDSVRLVLKASIDLGGTSFRDYVDTQGERGDFKGRLQVYGKQGKPCLHCGTPIRRIVVASRGTHFCPRCQKAPKKK